MNIWENAVITSKGLALQSKLTQGTSLTITRAVAGAGYVTPALLVQQTAVLDPKQTLKFSPVSYPEEGKCAVPVYLTNEGLATGYTAKQVGFYATDPDEGEILYFICQAASDKGTEIPSQTEMPGYTAEWTFYFQYGQASNVAVTVDPSNTITRAEVEEMMKKSGGIPIVDVITEDGSVYVATIDWLTLKTGTKITIIPNVTSGSANLRLRLNGQLYPIYRRTSSLRNTGEFDAEMVCIQGNRPFTLTYFTNREGEPGGFAMDDSAQPEADDLKGVVPIEKGGTGATTAAEALNNLGAASKTEVQAAHTAATTAQNIANSKAPMYTYGTEDLVAGETPLETGKLHFVYE